MLSLLVFLCSGRGLLVRGRKAADLSRRPQLLMLRGGVQPASVEEKLTLPSPTNNSANVSQPSEQSKGPTKRANPRPTFGVRDTVTAALGLSAAGAAQLCCQANLMAAMMALVPAHLRKPIWVLLAGTIAAALFLLMRITNPSRAIVVNRVLSKLFLH